MPDDRERCHRISNDSRYINYDDEAFKLSCTAAESNNIVEICPDGVQPLIRSISLRKGDHELMEAINRIAPFLYIQGLRDNQEMKFRQKVMAGRIAVQATNQTFQMGTVVGLVMLLIFGHLCAYLLLIFELIIGNRVRKVLREQFDKSGAASNKDLRSRSWN